MFRPKELLIAVAVLLVAFVEAVAAPATLVAKTPRGVLLPYRYYADISQFDRPSDDSGTTSPYAVVARLRGPLRFDVAIDATTPEATEPELVLLDFSGKGRFTDACTAPLKITAGAGHTIEAMIGPVPIHIPLDGRVLAVTVRGNYQRQGLTYRRLKIGFDVGLQGRCDFGGKTRTVCVVDGTGDLRPGDPFKPILRDGQVAGRTTGDTLMIDTGDGTFEDPSKVIRVCYGQPVWIDGAWYDVKVGDDGSSLQVDRVDLPTGRLKVAAANWEMILVSPQRVMWVSSTQPGQDLPLPAGSYVVMRFKQYAQFGESDSAAILVEGPSTNQGHMERIPSDPVVQIMPDGTAELAIGTPLTAEVEASVSGSEVRFSLKVTDAGGRSPDYVKIAGDRRPQPTLRVLDAAGKEVHAAAIEYGSEDAYTWRLPAGLRGEFTAQVEYPAPPFEVLTKAATFTIE